MVDTDNLKYHVSILKVNRDVPGRLDYCKESVGWQGIDWDIMCNINDGYGPDILYKYYFKNEADAVMFKLLYG